MHFAEVVPYSFHPSGAHNLTAASRLKARVVFEKTNSQQKVSQLNQEFESTNLEDTNRLAELTESFCN